MKPMLVIKNTNKIEIWNSWKTICPGLFIVKNPITALYGLSHEKSKLGFYQDKFTTINDAHYAAFLLKDIDWLQNKEKLNKVAYDIVISVYKKLNLGREK